MRPEDFLTDVMRALSFLSRIPVHDIFFENEHRTMGESARAFPAAGLLIALPAAMVAALFAHLNADALLTAAIVLGISTLVTGALHEDGLADTADGFGGGRTKERALEIMKDSRIGTYGTIALVLSFLIKVAALAALIRELSPVAIFAALLATACLSRGLMVWHWQALSPARDGGVAVSAGQPRESERNTALAFGFGIAILLVLPFFPTVPLAFALAAPCAATYLFNRFCIRKIEGHTGDTIGATQQITEIVMLAGLALIV